VLKLKKNTEYETKMKDKKRTLLVRSNYRGMSSTMQTPVTYSHSEVMSMYMKKAGEVNLY